jgi:hypothetical protein
MPTTNSQLLLAVATAATALGGASATQVYLYVVPINSVATSTPSKISYNFSPSALAGQCCLPTCLWKMVSNPVRVRVRVKTQTETLKGTQPPDLNSCFSLLRTSRLFASRWRVSTVNSESFSSPFSWSWRRPVPAAAPAPTRTSTCCGPRNATRPGSRPMIFSTPHA